MRGRSPPQFRRPVKLLARTAVLYLVVGNVVAGELDLDQIIDDRQRNLRDMGAAYKAITDELKRPRPSLIEIAHYASSLKEVAASQQQWFPAGSGAESGIKTAAKAEIWSQPADFAKWERDLSGAIAQLVNATAGQDIEIVRRQHEQLGKVCAGCHKTFRAKDD
jgi:cytochrome c556